MRGLRIGWLRRNEHQWRMVWRPLILLMLPALVVAVVYWLSFLWREPKPTFALRRINDLTNLANALHAYHGDHGAYPKSPGNGWLGIHNAWGASTLDWIPGIAPRYIAKLPRDPRNSQNGKFQYLYRSNGHDFKLLSFYPGNDCHFIRRTRPELLDPLRGGLKGSNWKCHAYGYWTEGAQKW